MIRVERGPEPPGLAAIRDEEIARVAAIEATRRATSAEIGKEYQVVHEALWKAQHYKCCYCECQEQSRRNDVEHYRPKAKAKRQPGSADEHGYWWLAWTWENLLFSCRNCNQSPAKLDKFPLAPGSTPLVARQQPPGQEQPLLIDPATESGSAHIVFVPEASGGATRWRPVPRNGSDRGRYTIKVCQLDRPDLLDLYSDHVEREITPLVNEIRAGIQANDEARVLAAWRRAGAALLRPGQRFVGLARDALDYLVPVAERVRWGLDLPPL